MQLQGNYREIWKLSYPLMLGSVAINIVNLINTAFLGRVSEAALGASAVAGVFYFALVFISSAICIGAQIIIARKAGEQKVHETGDVIDNAFMISTGLAVLLFACLVFISPLLFRILITSEEVYRESVNYLLFRSPGIFFSLYAFVFRSFYTGIGQTRIISIGIAIMAAVNILLDYALIFGNLGFPEMGIKGAGIASSVAELFSVSFFLFYSLKFLPREKFGHFRFRGPDKAVIKEILTLSLPMLFQNMISLGAWFLFFVVIEKTGEHPLAISNILRSVYMLLMTPIWGYSASATTLVSNLAGQDKKSEIPSLLRKIITISVVSAAVMVSVNIAAPRWLLSLFTNEAALIGDSLPLLPVLTLAMLLFSIAVIFLSTVAGLGDTRMALLIEVVSISSYMIYIFLVTFVFRLGLDWIWASEWLYWILLGGLSYLRIQRLLSAGKMA
jgi:putative MATE family efflux protein